MVFGQGNLRENIRKYHNFDAFVLSSFCCEKYSQVLVTERLVDFTWPAFAFSNWSFFLLVKRSWKMCVLNVSSRLDIYLELPPTNQFFMVVPVG